MAMQEIMSAIFLLAVLFLVLPSFLNTNSKLKQFIQNISIWAIIVLNYCCNYNLIYNEKNQFSHNRLFRKNGSTTN